VKGPEVGRLNRDGIVIHEAEEFEGMRASGNLAAKTLDMIGEHVRPGVTTGELDQICHEFMLAHDARPATLGYRGFTKSSCISINHVVCHGIPGDKRLKDGDILNIEVTHDSLMIGIEAVKPGATFGDIGAAIQQYVEPHGMSVVRDFCGHGLGRVFHSAPNVLHYGKPGTGPKLEPGMFFTIEPMVNLGRPETKVLGDNWTAVTRDKSLSAQFEHSIGVTEDGAEIFTLSPAGTFHPTF